MSLAFRLRHGGLTVDMTGIDALVRSLAAFPVRTRGELHHIARVTLVSRREDLALFDAAFAAVFDAAALPLDPHARRQSLPPKDDAQARYSSLPARQAEPETGADLPWATLPPAVGVGDDLHGRSIRIPERRPSPHLALAQHPFEVLGPDELAALGTVLAESWRRWPTRRSRRTVADRGGHRVELRRTVARARRTGFEPIELIGVRPAPRPRRVVLLCDVSQSMQQYSAAYVHLMWAAATGIDAEVFAFATTLTRLTATLRRTSPESAVEQATVTVADRFGGTRIATAVTTLLSSHHGQACRGAIVLVASDGWDSDPPEALAAAMARLRRRAYRVVWLNPRMAAPGFEPLVGAMAAALPFCDATFPADTPAALAEVVRTVASWQR